MERKNTEKLPTLHLDLTKPDQARRFLAGFHMPDGRRVLFVELTDKRHVKFAEATDDQMVDFASQIYAMYYAKGIGYFEEVH